MKKLISLLIALVLLALPLNGLAAPGDAILLRPEVGYGINLNGMVEADGTIYILTYDTLYTFAPGADTPEQCPFLQPEAEMEDGSTTINRSISAFIAYDGAPCFIVTEIANETDGVGEDMEYFSYAEGAWLYSLAYDGEGNATLGEELVELDWSDLIQGYGDYEYYSQCDRPFVVDGVLYFTSYDESGNDIIVVTDLEDGDTDIHYAADFGLTSYLDELCAYKDGLLLATSITYTADSNVVSFYSIDLGEEEMGLLAETPLSGRGVPDGLVYREGTDTLYFIMNGEIWALSGMDVESMQPVASVPVEAAYNVRPILTEDGYYIVGDYDAVVRRNTDPSLRADIRLTVQQNYNASIDNAYYAFTGEYGDVDVTMVQQVEDVVQAMMNRSSDVDIYCLGVDSAEFEAVYTRGYMAELGESEVLRTFVEGLYPFAQEVCMKDGEVVAVPVEIYTNCGGYDPEAFARLGLTEEDVPTTWEEFFNSLEPLAAKVAEEEGMMLFEGFSDYESARYMFLDTMISSYMAYISQPGSEKAFDTGAFRAALTACENVDWSKLGLDAPMDEYGYSWTSGSGTESEHNALYSSYGNTGADSYAVQAAFAPLVLGFDGEGQISGQMTVAYVNPFSEHRAEAIAFLESLTREMEPLVKIQLCPGENEPVRSRYYESTLESYEQMIADTQRQLEAAGSDEEKEAYAQLVEEYEGYRDEFLVYGAWDASAESIARYRQFAPKIAVVRNLGMGGDNASAFYELQNQFMDGMINADEFIEGVDGKLQMMMLEGM